MHIDIPLRLPNQMETADVHVVVTIRDVSQNQVVIDVMGWSIDSQLPTIEVYAPSQDSLYLYGESTVSYTHLTLTTNREV